ncbi:MAG: 23S rRNA (uracil(1939)-C(5))-methyltransferase RlmD [Coriobacteriia bacterium]|nr:23S rRNA (uracil(1939)-C(5))-methyltransferase RlmD [Coriobacteriia bacterium]MBS5477173.1 23S rRNA (uracil(1939)-C(5))-methyltransferase RlmD [Coriobacteriia bacterium]
MANTERGYQRATRDSNWRRDEHRARDAHQDGAPTASGDVPASTLQRSELVCPVAARCGGCEWLAMPYDEQLAMKQRRMEELFADTRIEVEPIIGMDDPQRYRNKVQLPFAPGRPDRDGRTTARWGIFERGTHRIVPCRECLVEDERARPIIATVADLLPRFNIKPYSERTNTGFLRYALVRTALHTGQVMLTLVASSNRLPSARTFVERLRAAHPELTTIVLNVNPERTSVILGKQERTLYGPGYIEDKICGCTFRISSSSFYQTNPIQAEKLYDLAIEMAQLESGDRFGDAYCGTGTIGIAAAVRSGAHLLGVERNADAVADARANAEANGLSTEQAEFVVGDAGSVFSRMARAGEHLDVVFMDPPRAGSTPAFLANLARLGPRRVVYISCEPRSQRHDITELMRFGYRVRRIRPVDMFPHTDHVENVVLLERVNRG